MHSTIKGLFAQHIKGTAPQAIVQKEIVLLCTLTLGVAKGINVMTRKVYINSRSLKHLYDKKPAEEFDFILEHLHEITRYPDHIYQNKNPKRGDYCFIKTINDLTYLVSLELVLGGEQSEEVALYVATSFRIRKISYLNSYNLLWSWKGGEPSS